MINAKELKDILKMEISPEGKVLLLGMITDGGVDLNMHATGDAYGMIPSEVHLGHLDLKAKQLVANGQSEGKYNVQRETVKYGSNTNMDSSSAKRGKRPASTGKKVSKKNKK
jgi:hypothetical protein